MAQREQLQNDPLPIALTVRASLTAEAPPHTARSPPAPGCAAAPPLARHSSNPPAPPAPDTPSPRCATVAAASSCHAGIAASHAAPPEPPGSPCRPRRETPLNEKAALLPWP